MSSRKIDKMALTAQKCFRKAVREQIRKKALLGQYVIINRNGKPWRVSAKKALEMIKSK
jgi:hypothetical protein